MGINCQLCSQADPNIGIGPPVILAARNRHTEVVSLLLEAGANPTVPLEWNQVHFMLSSFLA